MLKFNRVLILVLLIVSIVLGVLLVRQQRSLSDVPPTNSSVLMERITSIQELATIKYNYTGVLGYRDALKFFNFDIPFTEKYFLLKYNAYIKAGVNFSKIKIEIDDKYNVHVSMPQAEFFDIVIDENNITVYDESENGFNPIKISDYNQALISEKEVMRKDAINKGVLNDARVQAEGILRTFLKEMGYHNITITTELNLPDGL